MRTRTFGCLLAALAAVSTFGAEQAAKACGGCFHPPNENDSIITGHRMILSVSPKQSTLYDQISYQGSPSSFAWVLPIRGSVTIGLSSDVLFQALDLQTQSQVVPPSANCPVPNCGQNGGPSAAGFADATFPTASDAGSGVTVIAQQNVGPYSTVQLHATDPNALNNWLTQNGFAIPAAVQPIVDEYQKEQFDFLAMKLIPGQGVQAMRPVRVTTQGASAVLPLRMVAAGTGATVAITLWVVSDGRYEPQDFPWFHITDDELVWDWTTNSSNFSTLRQQKESALKGRGWEVENSMSIYQGTITSIVQNSGYYGGNTGDGGGAYQPGTYPDGGTEPPDQVQMDDLSTLFAGLTGQNARVTRLRGDIAHAALTEDLVLQASADQSELSNVHVISHEVNEPECPIYDNTCGIIGYGPRDQVAAAEGSSSAGGGAASCEASRARPEAGGVAFAAIIGMIGVAVARARRRRDQP